MIASLPLPRRRFLAAALSGASLAGTRVARPTLAADHEGRSWIDAHSHIWTRNIQEFPLAEGTTLADLDPPSFTTEELLKTARAEDVQRVVLIAHHKYYGFDNAYMIDAAKRYPGLFKVVGMVDELKMRPQNVMRQLGQQHVTGFRITPWTGGDKWLESPGMAAMWSTAATTGQAMCCLIDAAVLPAVDRMCARFPETTVVIDHFARIGVDGQIRDHDVRQLCRLARHQHSYVKVSAFYALGAKKPPYLDLVPMIRRVYESFGPQRLMWASDCPYQLQGEHTYAASIGLVRDRLDFLTPEDRQWMLRKTAEQVYFRRLNL